MIPLICLQGVSHAYGSTLALASIDFTVHEGERWGIAGPSGSGKSTLGRVLTLHQQPSSGMVKLFGFPVHSYNTKGLRRQKRRFQLVFQDPAATFEHQWETWQIIAEADAIAGADRVQQMKTAIHFVDRVRLPRTCLPRSPLELSGGERRRVALARALVANPNLLVLDEAFSGLDGPVQTELVELLDELQRDSGLATIHISHDLRLLRKVSSNLAILDRGGMVECGGTATVLENPQSAMARKLLQAADWSAK